MLKSTYNTSLYNVGRMDYITIYYLLHGRVGITKNSKEFLLTHVILLPSGVLGARMTYSESASLFFYPAAEQEPGPQHRPDADGVLPYESRVLPQQWISHTWCTWSCFCCLLCWNESQQQQQDHEILRLKKYYAFKRAPLPEGPGISASPKFKGLEEALDFPSPTLEELGAKERSTYFPQLPDRWTLPRANFSPRRVYPAQKIRPFILAAAAVKKAGFTKKFR